MTIYGESCWISPAGKQYPCDYGNNLYHGELAIMLVDEHYQQRFPMANGEFNTAKSQMFLLHRGWVRLDISGVACGSWNPSFQSPPSNEQIETLKQVYHAITDNPKIVAKNHFRAVIRKFLNENGVAI